ncbi:hypothetical protein NPIL_530101 [Nephila pilipes]|uniref:Secreted protein n=1 Tax=Nephila pilipes TaxID=299642 RepID=A0A8X6MQX0_NEPPI|nr:hypothetical protein NPIL_530101 [Nephila pilipes]
MHCGGPRSLIDAMATLCRLKTLVGLFAAISCLSNASSRVDINGRHVIKYVESPGAFKSFRGTSMRTLCFLRLVSGARSVLQVIYGVAYVCIRCNLL